MNTNNMTRADAYAAIKANSLQDECVKRFGKNFTICKTADLVALVNEKSASKPAPVEAAPAKEKVVEKKAKVKVEETVAPAEYVDTKARAAISELLTILEYKDTIENDEVKEIEDILGGRIDISSAPSEDYKPKSASPYSDDEIESMFGFVNE